MASMSPKSLTLSLLITALTPAVAYADGLPVPVEDAGPTGIVAPDGTARYVTVHARGGTLLEKIATRNGTILASRFLPGRLTIPVVSLSGAPEGLSPDGRRLVLIRPRRAFPRARTTFAVIDVSRRWLRPIRTISLRGDFSFDALSRNGSTAFLVNYIDPRNPTRYRVRALDLVHGKLAPKPILDPSEDADDMRGYPLDRVTSADG